MVDLLENVDRCKGGPCSEFAGGIVTFRSGEQFFSLNVLPDHDGEIEVRIEHGSYRGYDRDGRICDLSPEKHWVRRAEESHRDIVAFERCSWSDPRAKKLDSQVVP